TFEVVTGGEDEWVNAQTYSITGDSNGVVNLSGVQTVLGPSAWHRYGGYDWLTFNVQNGGNIRLDSLKQISRHTIFNLHTPRFDLPALQTVDSSTFNLDNGSKLYMTNLSRVDSCTINFGFNSTLNAPSLVNFVNTSLSVAPGVIVNAPAFTNVYGSVFSVSAGSSLRLGAPVYDTYQNWQTSPAILSADGTGSLLDASSMQSLTVYGGDGGAWTYSVTANNNGVIDLSSLLTATGARTDAYGNDDWLAFTMQNGGNILLNSLQQITRRTSFNIQVPQYTLPSLLAADTTTFTLGDGDRLNLPSLGQLASCSLSLGAGSVVNAPGLTNLPSDTINLGANSSFNAVNLARVDSSTISFGLNSTCNVPNLLNFVNTDLALAPGKTLIAPPFTNVYESRLGVSGGSTLYVAAPIYQTRDVYWSPTILSADGAGSLLDVSQMQTFEIIAGGEDEWASQSTYSITANHNGVIDLSGLKNIFGGNGWHRTGGYDWLNINVLNGGNIRLNSLQQVSRRTQFNLQVPDFSMPALQAADNTVFILGDGTTLHLPSLTQLQTSCSITFGFNSVFDAPNLRSYIDSDLSLTAGRSLLVPPFTNVYASRLSVAGGSTLHVGATDYDIWPDWRTSVALFSSDGIGSLLDLSAMKTFTAQGGWGGSWNYAVTANNYGVIDLSGLDTILGTRTDAYDNDDWLSFNAGTSAAIKFGNASVNRRTLFSASGAGSLLGFKGLYLRQPARLSVGGRAALDVKGNYAFENTDESSIALDGAVVQMDGTQPQTFEVGGQNVGPTGSGSGNFGCSQLIIGNSNQTSFVRLQDQFDNGNRGSSGEPEALYLYGLDGQGLRLLNNSRLILGNVPVYVFMGGQMRQLNNLIPAGTNSLAFEGGFIANTGGPRIISMAPAITVNPPVSSVDVTFDIPIKFETFTPADVVITGPSGTVAVSSVLPVAGNTYRIAFAPQTANGAYTVRVGPNIDEIAGNFTGMDQNGNGLAGEPSDAFTSSFTIDGVPPVLLRALAVQNGTRVGITFDEPVSPVFATNPANYLVNGLAPTNAVLQTNGYQVALSVSPLVGETFALTVNNLTDLYANTTNASGTGNILTFEQRDLGYPGSDPQEPGSTLTFSGTDFSIVGGGSYIWYYQDRAQFTFERRTGDFDVRVLVQGDSPTWLNPTAGILFRETLDANSRAIYAFYQPRNPSYLAALPAAG
ncbi:MAG: Ig-like domain-containing protein, partial [Verrucomicrobia bacterium]|nr:Ig-like domain-containing protein [Verrucomicrobiota bacterium]